MKIFTAKQLSHADHHTIKNQNISSLELMERAASKAFGQILPELKKELPIFIFVGIGNNGGDGLMIARQLIAHEFEVRVCIVEYSDHHSAEFNKNLERLKKQSPTVVQTIREGDELPAIDKNAVIIDALFGIGLNRPLLDWVGVLIDHLNESGAFSIAIDMPSGLFADRIPTVDQPVFQADLTLTFQAPKLVFFLSQTAAFAGEIRVIDIGLDRDFLMRTSTDYVLMTRADVCTLRQNRQRFSHKGTYGHCLTVGGSYGKMGSMVLATRAALRTGAGKVTVLSPQCGYDILQTSVPEAMVISSPDKKILGQFAPLPFEPSVVCFGMGSGTADITYKFFRHLLGATSQRMLIDADGLNLLAEHKDLCRSIPENSVLTPHPKELERLLGNWADDFDKLKKARQFVEKYRCILVLKDAVTMVVTIDKTYVNSTGNAGMATAGSGDVLSGCIAGLMAQGYSSEHAAVFGVYLHGKSGDIAVENSSEESLIAGDLIYNFGKAFLSLKTQY